MTAPRLTPARYRALEVLALSDVRAVISNRTSRGPVGRVDCVYWQTATWLVAQKLAWHDTPVSIQITDAGRMAWEAARR